MGCPVVRELAEVLQDFYRAKNNVLQQFCISLTAALPVSTADTGAVHF